MTCIQRCDIMQPMKCGWVYILASKRDGTIYIGVTSNIHQRIWQHKQKQVPGFTKTHGVDRLVYHEHFNRITDAIAQEKRLKNWERAWKIELIERENPEWDDLYDELGI